MRARTGFFALAATASTAAAATLITVNSLADLPLPQPADGLCTLREALVAADANLASGPAPGECAAGAVADRIRFSVAGLITLDPAAGPLPALGSDGNVTVDGWSAPGGGPGSPPRVGIDGGPLGGAGALTTGLTLSTNENVVRGLTIVGFGTGILIDGNANWLLGNHLGTNAAGDAARPNGVGVALAGNENLIGTDGDGVRDPAEANLISGNLTAGVLLDSLTGCDDNRVAGNRVGTTRDGTAALPNQGDGIHIVNGCARSIIGTNSSGDAFDPNERNLIGGNGGAGIRQSGSTDTVVAGNWIGLHRNGAAAIANAHGVLIDEYATGGARIGTDGDGIADLEEGNVISGNTAFGLYLQGRDVSVAGNTIGADPTGAFALPNGAIGVAIDNGSGAAGVAGPIAVGGAGAVFRNLIAGNGGHGVTTFAADVTIQCNAVLGHPLNGVWRSLGGTVTVETNTLGANGRGLRLETPTGVLHNAIAGNAVGVETFSPAALNLADNWWGDPSGPLAAGNPGGLGDSIVAAPGAGAPTYAPWDSTDQSTCN